MQTDRGAGVSGVGGVEGGHVERGRLRREPPEPGHPVRVQDGSETALAVCHHLEGLASPDGHPESDLDTQVLGVGIGPFVDSAVALYVENARRYRSGLTRVG